MRRSRMQGLLRLGLIIGIFTSLTYLYLQYNVPAVNNGIESNKRSGDNVRKQEGNNNGDTNNIEKEHSNNIDPNIPKEKLKNEEIRHKKEKEKKNDKKDGHVDKEASRRKENVPIADKKKHDSEKKADNLEGKNNAKRNESKTEREVDKLVPPKPDNSIKQEIPKEVGGLKAKADKEVHNVEQQSNDEGRKLIQKKTPSQMDVMHLSVVACGERVNDTLAMIKSACIVSTKKIHVHIFADDENQPKFRQMLSASKCVINGKVEFTVYPITYPRGEEKDWIKLFRPCATQRLFLPDVLPEVELILYVDTDILFLQSMDEIWRFFDDFNGTHIVALAPDHEDPNLGWYSRFARHPFYPPLGVNSGVMLMNLSRMREVKFADTMPSYLKQYKYSMKYGDQDLLNIYFHFHPDKLFVYPCQWNYRPDHCMNMSVCKTAEQHGAQVLHGSRQVFQSEEQPVFKAVFQAFQHYNIDDGLNTLVKSVKENLGSLKQTNCGKVGFLFTKVLEQMTMR